MADNGVRCIAEYPDMVSAIRQDVGDLDVAGAYPSNQAVFNISKETTSKELVEIEGVDPHVVKHENINLSGGSTNALEYCQLMMKFPSLPEIYEQYLKSRAQ